MTSKKARPSSSKTPANADSDAPSKPEGAPVLRWDPKKMGAADMAKAMNAVRAAARKARGLK